MSEETEHELVSPDEDQDLGWGCTCGGWACPADVNEATAESDHALHVADVNRPEEEPEEPEKET